MADYWKSIDKKYCEMCKCWLNDNRASIEFHENGKRHQENVQRRLKEIQRKTRTQDKAEKKEAKNLDKIERAALEAYNKDKEANPDISLKIQQYEDYMAEQRKRDGEEPAGGTDSAAGGSQPKILHRDEKKVKKEEQVLEQLAKPLPTYNPKGGWKPVANTKARVDLELPDPLPASSSEPGKKKSSRYDFQEKTVASMQPVSLGLSSSSSSSSSFMKSEREPPETVVAFKKRKFGRGNQMRKQGSDEEY